MIGNTSPPAAGVTLTAAQMDTVLGALADAAAYRRICIGRFCDCAGGCDEAAIGAYEALAAELGGGAQ